ncbi:methyl-accepting chemotaxis protein [Paenibacillus sp. FSL R10-2734]|uniref:methyl-accepting chemotaxis protein n=1 Tax=Paenibacillus sp. FSL R10-2734 TaxID=2954691 RepID=UPI0030D7F66F
MAKQRRRNVHLFRSISYEIFILLLVTIVGLVSAVGIYSYYESKKIITNEAAATNSEIIQQASQKLDIVLEKYENILYQIELNSGLHPAISDKEATADQLKAINNILHSYIANDINIVGVALIPKDETRPIYHTSTINTPTSAIQETAWFKQVVETPSYVTYIPTENTNLLSNEEVRTFGLAKSMNDSTRSSTHVLLIEINVNIFKTNLKLQLSKDSSLLLLSENYDPVYSSVQELEDTSSLFKLEDLSASGSLISKNNVGEKVLVSHDRLTKSRWYLINITPVSSLEEKAKAIFYITVIIITVAILFSILIGIFMARRIGRPLKSLSYLMELGASGDLTVTMDYKTKNEIGKLASGFNEMMSNITTLVNQANKSTQDVLVVSDSLKTSSSLTNQYAKEIAVATAETAEGSSSLVIQAEFGHTLAINIGAAVSDVISVTEEMNLFANRVEYVNEEGAQHLSVLYAKNAKAEEMIGSLVTKVSSLKMNIHSVGRILTLLDSMAKRTTILSLNASIEATRAGVAGKGFMVVADEVRQLALESKNSIEVVHDINTTLLQGIIETEDALSEAYPIFKEQTQSVNEVNIVLSKVQEEMNQFLSEMKLTKHSIELLEESQQKLTEGMSRVKAVAEHSSSASQEVAASTTEQLSISGNLTTLSSELQKVSFSLQETLFNFKTK